MPVSLALVRVGCSGTGCGFGVSGPAWRELDCVLCHHGGEGCCLSCAAGSGCCVVHMCDGVLATDQETL
jgi:hypothetical protein